LRPPQPFSCRRRPISPPRAFVGHFDPISEECQCPERAQRTDHRRASRHRRPGGGRGALSRHGSTSSCPEPPRRADHAPSPRRRRSSVAPPAVPDKPAEPPRWTVVFVLDTTGSMSGLIEARSADLGPSPTRSSAGSPTTRAHRAASVSGTDRDDYVTRRSRSPRTLDDVYANLRELRAEGGETRRSNVNRCAEAGDREHAWRGRTERAQADLPRRDDAPPARRTGRPVLQFGCPAGERAWASCSTPVRCGSRRDGVRGGADRAGQLAASTQHRADGAWWPPHALRPKLSESTPRCPQPAPTGRAEGKAAAVRRATVNASMDAWARPMMRQSTGRVRDG